MCTESEAEQWKLKVTIDQLTVVGMISCFFFVIRCFTFGIGSGASTALVEGLARAGNGSAEFVKEGERLQPKVSQHLLAFVYTQSYKHVSRM